MENFSHRNITGSIILDTRREKKEKSYPVKYRITYLRKQVYYNSGYDLTIEEWSKLSDTRIKDLKEIRKYIQEGFDILENHIKELKDNFSFEALHKKMSKGTTESLMNTFDKKVESLKNNGRLGTSDWYKYAKRSIEGYTNKDLKFSDISQDWLIRYEKWLLEKKRSYTTISMYMRALQAIINEGKDQGFINTAQYPFGKGKYEIPTGEGRNLALTLAQIGKIVNYTCEKPNEEMCRDLWYFSYLCNGINMVDLLKLKYMDMQNGEISFYRQKTITKSKKKKKIVVPLLPQMEVIISRWGNPETTQDTYIFPFLKDRLSPFQEQQIVKNTTKLVNTKMKKIGSKLELGKISTYTARHSFATVLKRSGANIAFISESLGHTDLETTENYLATFEKDERIKNANLLTNF